MKNFFKKQSISFLTIYLFSFLVILGYQGFVDIFVLWNMTVFSFLWFLIILVKKGKSSLPSGFWIFLMFLFLYLISFSWGKKPVEIINFFMMFVNGFFIWFITYNSQLKKRSLNLEVVILLLSVIFGFQFLFDRLVGNYEVGSFTLTLWTSSEFNHHHVGNLWSIVILVIFNKLINGKKPKLYLFILIPLGIYILVSAMSRSAVLSLLVGLVYLFYKNKAVQKNKSLIRITLALLFAIFVFISSQKTLFLSRLYFIQAIQAFLKNWKGIGIGNFKLISNNPEYYIQGLDNYSLFAHNIILEFMVGMGIFSLPFVVWLGKIILQIIKYQKTQGRLYAAIFLALSTDFMFDFNYFVPTMVFIWMASLGVFQKIAKEKITEKEK